MVAASIRAGALALLAIAIGSPSDADVIALTTADRSALSLTIYSNGLGLIRDRRSADIAAGTHRLRFEDVSRQMIPSSAFLSATDSAEDEGISQEEPIHVQSIDYQFGLLTPESLLQRAVGQEVGVVRSHPTTGEETVERARVLSTAGGVVLRYRDRVETGVPGRLVFDSVPPDLQAHPTLTATLESAGTLPELRLIYLTAGLGWEADYIVELDDAQRHLALIGRATLNNVSGTDFTDADVSLVAGEVARTSKLPTPPAPMPRATMADSRMSDEVREETLRQTIGDRYLYSVPRPVTLSDQETKQIDLVSADAVAFSQDYVSESNAPVFYVGRNRSTPEQATIRLRIRNDESTGPGVPLPAGVVRVYARDSGGALRFLGEEAIDHTAVGQEVELSPGRAFDVTVQRWQTDFRRSGLADGVVESGHRVAVANAKDEAVSVELIEIIPGEWTVIEQSQPFERTSADRAVWTVEVPAGGETEVTYRVRVQR